MNFSLYALLCLAAAMAIVQAYHPRDPKPLPPTDVACGLLPEKLITREDCQKALRQFTQEQGAITWERDDHYRSCGTCTLSISQPSINKPTETHHVANYEYAFVAMDQSIERCHGASSNATTGRVTVSLSAGNGQVCKDN
ncbi:hypothetical protein PtA15_18A416 [Puccinia triticina]|uniref:Uncharacterized protein n=1 Tax=Puccinia triticina TaxID=208348 RepID=A0ABY7DAG9_9BASI|nr:uncharacterized protein PtA15_18A416 [Puccinia triticina]WAQ93356.1 hypothetical protein PtA15_18A416 [Puccinia triticina]WAR63357.1 hypothetical protein PtB15_18B440 [Puccinia triticina]